MTDSSFFLLINQHLGRTGDITVTETSFQSELAHLIITIGNTIVIKTYFTCLSIRITTFIKDMAMIVTETSFPCLSIRISTFNEDKGHNYN